MKKLVSILSVYLCATSFASAAEITYSPYISTKVGYSFNDLAIDFSDLNLPNINEEGDDSDSFSVNALFDGIEEIARNFKLGIHSKNTYSINPGVLSYPKSRPERRSRLGIYTLQIGSFSTILQ